MAVMPVVRTFRMMTTTKPAREWTLKTSAEYASMANWQNTSTLKREPILSEILPEMGPQNAPAKLLMDKMTDPTMSGMLISVAPIALQSARIGENTLSGRMRTWMRTRARTNDSDAQNAS